MIITGDEDVSTTDEYTLIVVVSACSKLLEILMLKVVVKVDCNTCELFMVTEVDEVTVELTDELVVTLGDIEDTFSGTIGATDNIAGVVVTLVMCGWLYTFAFTVWRV